MTNPSQLTQRITALPDHDALTALVMVLRHQRAPLDPFSQHQQQARLRQALTQPEITTAVPAVTDATQGDLARAALTHLADTDQATRELISHALGIAHHDPDTQRDPLLLLGAGALVLWVFRADIELTHQPGKGWTFHFKTHGLSDSTITKLLGQLLGTYLTP